MGRGLRAEDIQTGKTYRAKHPRKLSVVLVGDPKIDDRTVLWVSPERNRVQYDGPAARLRRRFPLLRMKKFLQWASHPIDAEEGADG